jgi:hypothetical protein
VHHAGRGRVCEKTKLQRALRILLYTRTALHLVIIRKVKVQTPKDGETAG